MSCPIPVCAPKDVELSNLDSVCLCNEDKSSHPDGAPLLKAHLDGAPLLKAHPMCLRKPKRLTEKVDEFPDHQSPKSPGKRKTRSACTVLNDVQNKASLLDANPSPIGLRGEFQDKQQLKKRNQAQLLKILKKRRSKSASITENGAKKEASLSNDLPNLPSKKRRQAKTLEIPKKKRSKSVSTVANGAKKETVLGGEFSGHQQPKRKSLTKSPKIVKKRRSKSASTVVNDAKKEDIPNLVELRGEFSGHPPSKKRSQAKLPKSPKKKKTGPVSAVTKNVKKEANLLDVPNPIELGGGLPNHPFSNKRKQAKLPKNPKRKRSKSASVIENEAKKEANALDAIPIMVEKEVPIRPQSPTRSQVLQGSPSKMRPNSLSIKINDVKKEIGLIADTLNRIGNDVKKEVGLVADVPNTSKFHTAREAELERTTNYHNLLALGDSDLVLNVEKFKCPTCHIDVDVGRGVVLQECLHSFCKMCLADVIEFSETAAIKCPFISYAPFYSCECYLQEKEVKSIVTPEVYGRHLERSMAFAESEAANSFHCRTPACPGWCFIEGAICSFVCPVCYQTNCLMCATVHEGKCMKEMAHQYLDNLTVGCDIGKEAEDTIECLQSEFQKIKEDECERKTDYHDLLALEDVDLVSNVEKFECPICFSDVNAGEGAILQECLHNFCKECLAGAVQHSETAVVRCPFVNDEYSCESFLQEREIKSLVTPDVYEKHLQRSVSLAESQAQNSFHCKTPDCAGWCLFEDDVNVFICPVCYHTNCLTCAAIHEGKNCKEYQDDVAFMSDSSSEAMKTKKYIQDNLDEGKAMRCPQCQIIIMKKEGCDWLTCSMCHTEVCWCTKGPRWGPGGKGDVSGGCKCKVNGVPCHPNCRNCH